MSDDKVKKYKLAELGEEAAHALTYCQVLIALRTDPRRRTLAQANLILEYAAAIKTMQELMPEREIEARRMRGMKLLAEVGIVEVQRDGNGELQPTAINEDRIDRRTTLITGAFQ